ncbi:MAG: bifunctional adenosylcobinamide kinase/adenosylcobinamide-phosphate guanylyltransferase [Pseudomonadota bacterium]
MEISEKQTMLVIGGCRSGKSRFAEQWATDRFLRKTYIATMVTGNDKEMVKRVWMHRKSRGENWHTVEESCSITTVLSDLRNESDVFLVDCLTLWLTNLILEEQTDEVILGKVEELAHAIDECPVSVVLVANEVGLGIVPESSLARRFRDLAGWCNQKLGAHCDKVVFMAAGLPIYLKK